MSLNDKNIQKAIKGKKNVRGYVKTIQKRIRDGVEVDEEVIVILVDEKVPRDRRNTYRCRDLRKS